MDDEIRHAMGTMTRIERAEIQKLVQERQSQWTGTPLSHLDIMDIQMAIPELYERTRVGVRNAWWSKRKAQDRGYIIQPINLCVIQLYMIEFTSNVWYIVGCLLIWPRMRI